MADIIKKVSFWDRIFNKNIAAFDPEHPCGNEPIVFKFPKKGPGIPFPTDKCPTMQGINHKEESLAVKVDLTQNKL